MMKKTKTEYLCAIVHKNRHRLSGLDSIIVKYKTLRPSDYGRPNKDTNKSHREF